MVWDTFFPRLPAWQRGGGLELFGQCPYRATTFQKGASLICNLLFGKKLVTKGGKGGGEHTWYLSFFTNLNLRPRNFTLESAWLCGKTVCKISLWNFPVGIRKKLQSKILHTVLSRFYALSIGTRKQIAMIVTNIKYGGWVDPFIEPTLKALNARLPKQLREMSKYLH